MSKYTDFVNTVVANSSVAAPTVEMRAFKIAGDGKARVVADVYHTSESRANPALALAEIGKKLQNKMVAVAGTFESVDKGQFVERISGLVSVNKQCVAVGQELKGFRAVASNMFIDEEHDMWVLRKTEAGDLMIKTTGVEDDVSIANLLQAVCSAGGKNLSFSSLSSYKGVQVEGGDCVSYVAADNRLSLGFVVASVEGSDDLIVQSMEGTQPEVVQKEAVTEVHDVATFPEDNESPEEQVGAVVASARGAASVAEIAAYYKRVFARNAKFYAEFMKRFNQKRFA